MSDLLVNEVPFVGLYDQFYTTMSTLTVQGMKAVEHEDKEDNLDFSVDPLSDPRLDRMDLFNMVDSKDRDKVMSATASFETSDFESSENAQSVPNVSVSSEPSSGSGSGE